MPKPAPRPATEGKPEPGPLGHISDQIRAVIKARGLTPYAVGKLAKVDPSVIHRFVNEKRGLTSNTIDVVCAALGLDLKETRRGRRANPG